MKHIAKSIRADTMSRWDAYYANISNGQSEAVKYPAEIIKKLEINEVDVVLQLGCGTGDHIPGILKLLPGIKAYGIEISKTAIALRTTNNIIRGDICYMPFEDNTFTKLFAFGVIEHTPETVLVMSEIGRVLKRNARIHFSVPNKISFFHLWKAFLMFLDRLNFRRRKFWKIGYEKSFRLGELLNLLKKHGFRICEFAIYPSCDARMKNMFNDRSSFIHAMDLILNKIKKRTFGFFIHVTAEKTSRS